MVPDRSFDVAGRLYYNRRHNIKLRVSTTVSTTSETENRATTRIENRPPRLNDAGVRQASERHKHVSPLAFQQQASTPHIAYTRILKRANSQTVYSI